MPGRQIFHITDELEDDGPSVDDAALAEAGPLQATAGAGDESPTQILRRKPEVSLAALTGRRSIALAGGTLAAAGLAITLVGEDRGGQRSTERVRPERSAPAVSELSPKPARRRVTEVRRDRDTRSARRPQRRVSRSQDTPPAKRPSKGPTHRQATPRPVPPHRPPRPAIPPEFL